MHRRIWFLAAAAFALAALAGSASAMTKGASSKVASHSSANKVQPFAKSWAATPRTPAGRAASLTINVAQEQDLQPGCGWNVNEANCTLAWAVWVGWNAELRSPYLIAYVNGAYVYKPDLATKVQISSKTIKYTIRPTARWFWKGHAVKKVGCSDFIYTVKMLNNPNNNVAGNTGVNQISGATCGGAGTATSPYTVLFTWKKAGEKSLGGDASSIGCTGHNACGPFADYRDLLGSILPQHATGSLGFNTQLFNHCVCGSDGAPVSDGPYYMSNYTRGQGVTLKKNPKGWFGKTATLNTLNFKIITHIDSEIQAIKGGEVDVASPQPTPAVAPLAHVNSITYKTAPGNFLEHMDINESGANTNDILKQAYFRQAMMLGINRAGLIQAALPGVAPGLKPDNSLWYLSGGPQPFSKYNYDAQAAIDKLRNNGCTSGPLHPTSNNNNYYTCNGHNAEFTFTYASDNPRRTLSEQIVQSNLRSIGIKVDPDAQATGDMFNKIFGNNYDVGEFAWGGSPDPGGFYSIWHCGGDSNVGASCNHSADTYMNDSLTQLNATTRTSDFQHADQLMTNNVPAIPLYALPEVLTYKKAVGGVKVNPASGLTWNTEFWFWS